MPRNAVYEHGIASITRNTAHLVVGRRSPPPPPPPRRRVLSRGPRARAIVIADARRWPSRGFRLIRLIIFFSIRFLFSLFLASVALALVSGTRLHHRRKRTLYTVYNSGSQAFLNSCHYQSFETNTASHSCSNIKTQTVRFRRHIFFMCF